MSYDKYYRIRCDGCNLYCIPFDEETDYGCSSYDPPEPLDPYHYCKKCAKELYAKKLRGFKNGSRSGYWHKSSGGFKMITLQQLKDMTPDTIFASGTGLIVHPWFNSGCPNLVDEQGKPNEHGHYVLVKWVAIRGYIHDWAIYHSLDANLEPSDYLGGFQHLMASDQQVADYGAKLHDRETIKRFVPCDDEALEMYRD